MTLFDRFTKQAQEVARLAADICEQYGHNQIDTEHILIALIRQPNSIVVKILTALNVDTGIIIKRLDEVLRASPKANVFSGASEQIFLTPRVKLLIDLANDEANQLKDKRISSEHIFLAIFNEKNSPTIRILKSAQVTREQVHDWIKKNHTQKESKPDSVSKITENPIGKKQSLQVFLCHSSDDKPKVRELYHRLSSEGINPWLDEENLLPGQDWQIEIPKAVRNSDVVIVCLSKDAITKTGYVQKEIKQALDVADEQPEGTIFIIPLKLEECEVPKRLSRWQWVNLFSDSGYQRLLRSLNIRAEEKKKSNQVNSA